MHCLLFAVPLSISVRLLMYEDSRINQVSFTTHRHPTEYLRCDIHHVDDMQPQNAYSRTQTHPHKTHPPPRIPTPHPPAKEYVDKHVEKRNSSTPTTPTHPTPRTNLAHKPTLGMNHLPGHPPTILGHQPRNQTRRIIRQTPSAEREQGHKRLPHAVGHIRI